jgi:hypothetical protein
VKGSTIVRGGGGLDNEVCNTIRTAVVIAGSPVIYSGLLNMGNVNGVVIFTFRIKSESRYKLIMDKYKVRIGMLDVGTLTYRSRELVDVLMRRKVNIFCVPETK